MKSADHYVPTCLTRVGGSADSPICRDALTPNPSHAARVSRAPLRKRFTRSGQ